MNRHSLIDISNFIQKRNSDGHDGDVTLEVSTLQDNDNNGGMRRGQWIYPGLDGGIEVAVKYTRPGGADEEKVSHLLKLFVREVRMWQKIKPHPNVLPLVGYISNTLEFGVVFPYAPEGNLNSLLQTSGRSLENEGRYQLVKDVADGILHLHRNGIVHGNLHEDNVVIWDQRAVIMDFGLSLQISSGSLSRPNSVGNLVSQWLRELPVPAESRPSLRTYLVVPELKEHPTSDLTFEADIYLFGLLARKIMLSFRTLRALMRAVPRTFLELVNECLAANPIDRPEAEDIVSRLTEIILSG